MQAVPHPTNHFTSNAQAKLKRICTVYYYLTQVKTSLTMIALLIVHEQHTAQCIITDTSSLR